MEIDPFGRAGAGMRRLFRSMGIAASGLTAQARRMETIAQNLANAETTRTPEGTPYRRRVVLLEPSQASPAMYSAEPGLASPREFPELFGRPRPDGVRVSGVAEDSTPGRVEYDPGHPHADERGYVRYPNVTMEEELTDLMGARRAFEANATVFEVAKAILRRALEI